jgi:hypothetical protein
MNRLTRGKAIQLFCHECCGWDARRKEDGKSLVSYQSAGHEVKKCESKICPLRPYRNGIEENESIPRKKKSDNTTMLKQAAPKSRQKSKEVSTYA